MSTVAKELRPGASYWEAVGEAIAQLAGECNKLLPIALEPENVVKSTFLLLSCRRSMTRHVRQSPAHRPGSCVSTKSEPARRSTSRQSAKPHSSKTRFKVLFAVSSRETRPSKSRLLKLNSWNAAWKRARGNRIRSSSLRRSSRKGGNRSERMRKRWSSCRQIWMPWSRITLNSRLWPHQRDKVWGLRYLLYQHAQLFRSIAAGNQPAESDNAPIEGSVETSHLLEQVRYTIRLTMIQHLIRS
jgi:dynactin 1